MHSSTKNKTIAQRYRWVYAYVFTTTFFVVIGIAMTITGSSLGGSGGFGRNSREFVGISTGLFYAMIFAYLLASRSVRLVKKALFILLGLQLLGTVVAVSRHDLYGITAEFIQISMAILVLRQLSTTKTSDAQG